MNPGATRMVKVLFSELRHQRGELSEEAALLGYVVSRLHAGDKSQAQLFQDLWTLFESRAKRGGYFVEFGALDGDTLSNTVLLERGYGWNGILAEPNPKYWDALKRNRDAKISHACVWSKSGEKLPLLLADEFSTIESYKASDQHATTRETNQGVVEADTITLMDLLEECGAPREIDFMSVDTEGSEAEILGAFDFKKYAVRTLCVEHNFTPQRAVIEKLMAANGYTKRFETLSEWDDWYVLAK